MEILYCDNKVVVCVKPAGVLSTDEPGGLPSLLRAALGGDDRRIFTVHRLDAAVGGVMVCARTRRAASDLGRAVRDGELFKEYLAVVRGVPPEPEGTLRDLLWRDTRRGMTFVAEAPGKDVKEAALEYETLSEREGLSLVKIRLITGRTHQIRCQFSHRGLPLWGDRKYGPPGQTGPVALWSHALAFHHPATGERMAFREPPPAREPWTLFEEELWRQN